MIRMRSTIKNREDMELEITISMTVGEWIVLERQLPTSYPSWKFGAMLAELIGKTNIDLKTEGEVNAS